MEKNSPGPGSELNRRDFLRGSSFAGLMSLLGGVELLAPKKAEAVDVETLVSYSVKCAVIGLGARGREIVSTLAAIKEAQVVAVCDNYGASLRRGAKAAPNAKAVEDYKAILQDPDIKAVLLATPTHLHKDIAIEALTAGKHVYCEAPLAHTLEDTRAIARAARAVPKLYFQTGLTARSHPQSQFLYPFIRAGAAGKIVKARSQWQKKQSWRLTSPNPEREKEINWRLNKELSAGLAGEIGVHQFDLVNWYIGAQPKAISGYGKTMLWNDGRDVPDTIQVLVEYDNGVAFNYECTLANSFEAEYDVLYGTDAAVMARGQKAWMFKEVDAPLLGWEVYARKDIFFNDTGIALMADASKQKALTAKATEATPYTETPLAFALKNFLFNVNEVSNGVEDFSATFDVNDTKALVKFLSEIKKQPAASLEDGYVATVLALKANEAVMKNGRVELSKELLTIPG